uniref:Copine-3 n=1 Tax=Ciona savignyi TaxID=51511 RepID=H2YRL9_CIOSA
MSLMLSKVELRISCKDLSSKDALSASDPVVVVKSREPSGKYTEVGRTEKVKNCNSPEFAEAIELDYRFEEFQQLKFKVIDIDNDSETLDDDDDLGSVELTLAQIVSEKELTKTLSKSSDQSDSTITIKATEITNVHEVEFSLRGEGLDKKDFLGKSDPFLEIYKSEPNEEWTLVYKSEIAKATLNPVWNKFSVRIQALCGGDMNSPIKVSCCIDFDKDGEHDLIGECYASLSDLIDVKPLPSIALINPKKRAKKKGYKKSGRITFARCKIVKKYSFLDYVFGGCKINFTVTTQPLIPSSCGVDFTGSNGDPRRKDSLHYLEGMRPNEYSQAIQSIGRVIQDYDSDQMYPAFGFGAKIPPNHEISHEFPLNMNPQNPYCQGVEGLMAAYHSAIRNVRLWGPTNIAPIINHVGRFAFEAQLNPKAAQYFVLLIITDGEITDMEETSHAIVRASRLPMSIIIVGVGNADFTAMEFLDGDDGVLTSFVDGSKAVRDVVQFVPFRKFKMSSVSALSSSVLGEIPQQVTEYFSMQNLPPGGETQASNPDSTTL